MSDDKRVDELEKKVDELETDNKANEMNIEDNVKEISELKEQIPATKEEYLNLALKCLKNREGLREIIYIVVPQHLRKELLSKLDAKDSIHNDPIIKKYQEKFQEIKDGSKSADSGGILGGAKKKRNIDLKVDEQPSELYELYMKDKGQYYFKKTTHPFTQFNNMVHLGIGEMKTERADLEWLFELAMAGVYVMPTEDIEKVHKLKKKYGEDKE